MGSCAAPSAKGDDKFITTDYLQQCHTWFRDQVAAGRQQLKRGDVLPHDMVESSAAAWRDEMSRKVADK